MGAFSARSPFSYFGAQRELLEILAYEPVLFLAIFAIGTGRARSFPTASGADCWSCCRWRSWPCPGAGHPAGKIALRYRWPHTELISGPYVEYSGPYLATWRSPTGSSWRSCFGIMTLFFWTDNTVDLGPRKVVIAFWHSSWRS